MVAVNTLSQSKFALKDLMTDMVFGDFHMFGFVIDVLLRVFSNLKTIILKGYIYFMSLKKKRKSPYPFPSAKKPSKREKGSNSFDKGSS